MTENEKYMIPETLYSILNTLKASYLAYADEKKINICDTSTKFGWNYELIIEAKNTVLLCDIEKEVEHYQKVIDDTRKYLIEIGGVYLG